MNDFDKIGIDAVKALKALTVAKANKKAKTAKATELIEQRNETARPLLQQVHDHIAAGQLVNGQNTWNGWAKAAGWSKRALNYILNGRPKQEGGNSSSRSALLKELLDVCNCTKDAAVIRAKAAMIMDEINYSPKSQAEVDGLVYDATADSTISPKTFEKLVNKPEPKVTHYKSSARKTLCMTRMPNRKLKGKVYVKDGETPTCPECIAIREGNFGGGTLHEQAKAVKARRAAKPVDERTEYMRRMRLVKRAAKFFGGMMDEYHAQNGHGTDARYSSLRGMYNNVEGFPWTPPTKDYRLPETHKEFKTQYEKAWTAFHTTLAEGCAKGWMTSGSHDGRKVETVPEVLSDNCPPTEEVL